MADEWNENVIEYPDGRLVRVERMIDDEGERRSNSSGGSRNQPRNLHPGTFDKISIPSKYVGRLIGRGGSKIKEIVQQSRARVEVGERGYDTAEILIVGNPDCRQCAKDIINEFIESLEPKPFVYVEPPKAEPIDMPTIDLKQLHDECVAKEKEYWAKFPKIIKKFYAELPEVANRNPAEVQRFRAEQNNIVVDRPLEDGQAMAPILNPVTSFYEAFHNNQEILDVIKNAGFTTPSPIQCQTWPILLSGEDMIGIAQTGTGKTLAFLLPALIHIVGQNSPRANRKGPIALVLAPTRELAIQIHKEVLKYTYRDTKSICIYGGADRNAQIKDVKEGADIIIATPGRYDDLTMAGHIDPQTISYVVLDEADRMLDMGFEPQIRKTLYQVRPDRQTVMTSATWPSGIRRLAKSYTNNPVQVYVGSLDLAAVHSVEQKVVMMRGDDDDFKMETLVNFIDNMAATDKVIVFCSLKSKAAFLSAELSCMGVNCASIYGSLEQCEREQAIEDISDGTVRILIATDVASRGIDIDSLTHVINYDFPRNIEEYVHRVGRTGRAGQRGTSISYINRKDFRHAGELIKILEEAQQEVPEELRKMSKRYDHHVERNEGQSSRNSSRYRHGSPR